jgi:hypothetical protein
MKSDHLDRIAWATIKAKVPSTDPPMGYAKSGRPCNYAELGEMLGDEVEFELAWSEFLHEFFRYRTADFFAHPSPPALPPERRAMLAGAAEYLCLDFGLPVPEWVNESQYFLPDYWDPWEDLCPDLAETRAGRIAKTPEAFLKRRVVFEARNLITL